jgi:hypothetical protein
VPEPNGEPLEDAVDGDQQGRGEAGSSPRKPARRKARPAAGEKCGAHKLTLPDSVFTRLELTAIKRGSTASAVAAEILDRNLPRLRIAADDRAGPIRKPSGPEAAQVMMGHSRAGRGGGQEDRPGFRSPRRI